MENEIKKIEISLKKYYKYLPDKNTYIHQHIDQWADLRDYYIYNYPHCGNDEVKNLFINEFIKRKKELYNENYIEQLKDLVSLADTYHPVEIDFLKEFIEKMIEKHGENDAERYICEKEHTIDLYKYLFEKINEIENAIEIKNEDKEWEKNKIIMKFIKEKKYLERSMNLYTYLEIRKFEKENK